jgi:serine/threonine protein kinase
MLAPGEWIDDFEILGTLGRGAFAIVYRARQESLGRVVALKVSSERGDEARTLAQLDHPHIVRVYDRRRLTDQKLQLVYEQLLPGGSLAAVVPRVRQTPPASRSGELLAGAVARACTESSLEVDPTSGSLGSLAAEPWPVVVARLGGQIAAALAHAHAAGVLHRDVKPANVLLSASGTAHLADFNTSSLVSHPIYGPCAYFGGSLAYMSPEQLEAFDPTHERRPDDLDGRVDIYSLGVLLWELLAGRRPFSDDGPAGGSLPDRLRALIDCRRRPPAPLAPEVARSAAGLVAILEACLAGDRERRPADAAELAARLAACARPENSRLFSGRRRGFQGFATRHPLAAVAVCVLVPNMALGVFNYIYNHRLLVALYERSDLAEKLPALEAAFQKSAAWLNGIVFPAGLFFAWFFTRPISQLLRLPVAEQATAVLLRQRARRRGLWLGDAAAWVGVCEWMFAGIAFPIILAWHLGPLPSEVPLLYMQSPLACGLLAAAYPFFFTSLLVLRCFIPAALEPGEPPAEGESLALERLATRSGWYLLVAGGVPLGTLGLLVARGSTDRVALTLLTVAGLVGLVVAWWSHEAIRRDTSAILEATGPVDPLAPDSVRTSRRGSDSTRPPSA